ncbi:MAG: phospholipase D-like domain-containing protein [Pseudomonadota bacterium]
MTAASKTVALKADFAELDRLLRESAADAVLDDDEKFELRELGGSLSRDRVRYLRNRAFDLVRERWTQPGPGLDPTPLTMLRWLEQVVKTLDASADPPAVEADAFFAPGEDCLRKLRELCVGAKRSIDACVYTIADDRLTEALIDAHRRGLTVRILSDNHKVHDTGSDVHRLRDRGIDVRLDDSDFHMHHKFALFDGARLANGSFNWTRGASIGNEENLVVTDDVRLVRAFAERFERLWGRFALDRR